MKLLSLILISCTFAFVPLLFVGCETMRISGAIGYIDPESGAKAGLTISDNKGGWWVKIPGPKQPDGTPGGVFVVEGDLPQVDRKSGK